MNKEKYVFASDAGKLYVLFRLTRRRIAGVRDAV